MTLGSQDSDLIDLFDVAQDAEGWAYVFVDDRVIFAIEMKIPGKLWLVYRDDDEKVMGEHGTYSAALLHACQLVIAWLIEEPHDKPTL